MNHKSAKIKLIHVAIRGNMKPFVRFLSLCLAFSLTACVTFGGKDVAPLEDLEPQGGESFSLQLSLYDLDGSGRPVRVEGGVVELERYAVEQMTIQGYSYVPGTPADTDYALDLHLLCFDPKQMAGAKAPVVMEFPARPFGSDVPVPGEAAAFGPDIQRLRMAPDACAALNQVVVHVRGEDGETYEKEWSLRAPYDMGCPTSACMPMFKRNLRKMTAEYF